MTALTSAAEIAPLTFTSARKFVPSTAWPLRDFELPTSEAETAPSPFTSPRRTRTAPATVELTFPEVSRTVFSVTPTRWALVTPVRFTTYSRVSAPIPLLETVPAPEVTATESVLVEDSQI